MATFIVPTDFSETAKNAALFAAQMAKAINKDVQLVLYHVYDEIFAGSDGSPLNDDTGAREKIFDAALQSTKTDMLAAGNVNVKTIAERSNSFNTSLQHLVAAHNADLIIMGITGSSKLEQTLIGSNTLHIVNKNFCPVMIIPPLARFTGISNIALATDLHDIQNSKAIENLKSILEIFKADVHIVNVSEDPASLSEEQARERTHLQELFGNYNPRFHLMRGLDVVNTIDKFVADNYIDFLITVPRKHVLGGLFQTSQTKRLAYHSHIPIIAVHE